MSVLKNLSWRLCKPLVYEDEEQARQCYLLNIILWISIIITTIITITLSAILPQWAVRWIGVVIVVDAFSLFLLWLNRKGHTQFAALFWIISAWIIATGMVVTGGGLSAASTGFYPVIVVMAGIVIEKKAGFITAGICCLTGLGLVLLEKTGTLPSSIIHLDLLTRWLTFTGVIVVIVSLQYLSNKTIRQALEQVRRENRERETAEKSLQISEQRFRVLIENAPVGISLVRSQIITYANMAYVKMFGYESSYEILGHSYLELTTPESREQIVEMLKERDKHPEGFNFDAVGIRKDGSTFDIQVATTLISMADGSASISFVSDITVRKQAQEMVIEALEQLKMSEERYMLAVEGSNDAIFDLNATTGEIYFSDRIYDILGEERRESNFTRAEDIQELISPEDYQKVTRMIQTDIEEHKPLLRYELCMQKKNKEIRWILLRGRAIYNALGKLERLTGSLTNITERMANQQKIYQMAYYDSLTGLPNRAMLTEVLDQELIRCHNENCRVGLIFMDIDNFKIINDTCGHSFGNLVLCEISTKLCSHGFANTLTTRYGGDEFIILLSNIENRAIVETFTKEIMKTFENPIQIGFQSFNISLSVGIAIYPDDGETGDELLKSADIAMYKAKDTGKKQYLFYNPVMTQEITAKSKLESDLRKALANKEFILYYQPQINIGGNGCCGFEALIRWPDPMKGIILPFQFIPLAEETGLIIELGKWVLYNSCIFGKKLNQNGFTQLISVNVSPVQLNQGNFVDIVSAVIQDTGIEPGYLGLEITETALMASFEDNIIKIRKLRDLGVKILMDDFGTGYSSLYYLKDMPIDILKIDKSFIRDICHDQYSYHLTETIVALAHRLGIKVVAEGVETVEQMEILTRFQCDMIQGFLISRPVEEPKVMEILGTL